MVDDLLSHARTAGVAASLEVEGERRPLSKITSIARAPGSGIFTVDGKPGGALPELAKLNSGYLIGSSNRNY